MIEAPQVEDVTYRQASAEAMAMDDDAMAAQHAQLHTVGTRLLNEFQQAENDRRLTELRWLTDLRQYRGQYEPDVLAKIGANRSKAFVRKTRVKVKTVDARMLELAFPSTSERNFAIEPTPKPSLAPEQMAEIKAVLTQAAGKPPMPKEVEKVAVELAKVSAKAMTTTIDDQLVECGYKAVAKQVLHSGNLYGTGILKAPLVEKKVRTRFVQENGRWQMKTEAYIAPFVDFVPLWRFYPDMSSTTLDGCRYAYERHLMTKTDMIKLAERKSFNTTAVLNHVKANPNGHLRLRYYDTELRIIGERQATNVNNTCQYEVLERWGWLEAEYLVQAGIKIPEDRLSEMFFTNIWLLPNGEVIKAVIQPIDGVTWPYHFYYFDKDETNIFGEGLAAIMRDDQTMLNASVRMILDNAALTAGPQFEANMSLMAKGERADEMAPFKIWPRSGTGEDARAPALRVLQIPNAIADLSNIASMFEQNADETTAIPRYVTGDNPTAGAAGTMGGLSMLMGNVSVVLKDQLVSYDEGVTKSFIQALYRWNMKFNPDPEIKGDFDVRPCAVATLMAKEVRAQQLDAFAEQVNNPLDAPFIKRYNLLRQRAEAHDLADVVMSDEEVEEQQNSEIAKAQAQLADATQKLQLAALQGQVQKLGAEVSRIMAEASRVSADAMAKKVGAAYSAMQAAGVAVTSPHIAPAADAILQSAGWQDANGAPMPENVGTDVQQQPAIPPEQGPEVGHQAGMDAGIETPALGDGNANQ